MSAIACACDEVAVTLFDGRPRLSVEPAAVSIYSTIPGRIVESRNQHVHDAVYCIEHFGKNQLLDQVRADGIARSFIDRTPGSATVMAVCP